MTQGIQSIQRGFALLRIVSARNDTGVSLGEVTEISGLTRSTAHRIINALIEEHFIERHPGTKRYHLGLEFFSLGSSFSQRHNLQDIARPAMLKLAEITGDTIFLSIRSGDDAVCIARIEGTYPIKALTLSVGSRRPLGIGAGSLALLAALDDNVIHEIYDRNPSRMESYSGADREDLFKFVSDTRSRGYSLNDGRIIQGMSAIGVVILDQHSEPLAALSIAAISKRLPPDKRVHYFHRLVEARDLIVRRLGERPI